MRGNNGGGIKGAKVGYRPGLLTDGMLKEIYEGRGDDCLLEIKMCEGRGMGSAAWKKGMSESFRLC